MQKADAPADVVRVEADEMAQAVRHEHRACLRHTHDATTSEKWMPKPQQNLAAQASWKTEAAYSDQQRKNSADTYQLRPSAAPRASP